MKETVRITSIAAGGDGVGRLSDGRVVFLPRTAPGDLVEVGELERRSSFARGWPERIVERSSDRVDPQCVHYDGDQCGGCQLQHLSGDAQRTAKRRIVSDVLQRIGKVEVDVPPVTTAGGEESAWAYRNRITLAVGQNGTMGFHRAGRPDAVFRVTQCAIARPMANRLLDAVNRIRVWPEGTTHLTLREDAGGEPHLILWSEERPAPDAIKEIREAVVAAGMDAVPGLWWRNRVGRLLALTEGHGAPGLVAFEQIQPVFGAAIRAFAIGLLGDVTGRLIWDLYAGRGETTRLLHERRARVESVEQDPDLVAVAGATPLEGVRRSTGRVEDLLSQLSEPAAVVVNPPRAGLGASVTTGLASSGAGQIVYISCDPATLARDVRRLAGRYRLERVQPFDLFPQTAHVETVALLVRA